MKLAFAMGIFLTLISCGKSNRTNQDSFDVNSSLTASSQEPKTSLEFNFLNLSKGDFLRRDIEWKKLIAENINRTFRLGKEKNLNIIDQKTGVKATLSTALAFGLDYDLEHDIFDEKNFYQIKIDYSKFNAFFSAEEETFFIEDFNKPEFFARTNNVGLYIKFSLPLSALNEFGRNIIPEIGGYYVEQQMLEGNIRITVDTNNIYPLLNNAVEKINNDDKLVYCRINTKAPVARIGQLGLQDESMIVCKK